MSGLPSVCLILVARRRTRALRAYFLRLLMFPFLTVVGSIESFSLLRFFGTSSPPPALVPTGAGANPLLVLSFPGPSRPAAPVFILGPLLFLLFPKEV